MGMTLTENILANRAGMKEVKPGDLIFVKIDIAMATDISSPLTIKIFKEMGGEKVFDPRKSRWFTTTWFPLKTFNLLSFLK